MKEKKVSLIPKPPRGIGISRRLLILMGVVVFSVIVLFLVFLHQTTPHRAIHQQRPDETLVDADGAASIIEKIQHQSTVPIVLTTTQSIPTVKENTTPSLSNDEFKEAAQSTISVYQKPETPQPKSQENQKTTGNHFIPSALKPAISPYELKAGTIIPATLLTGIDSDLPGEIVAKVRQPVFDTRTGNYLLIPQGTTLIGRYDSQIVYGQSRVLIVWTRLIFPNGSSLDLQGMPGVDLMGLAGLKDKVNNHYFRVFSSALLLSAFGAAGQLSQPQNNTGQLTTQQILYAAIGQQLSQTGSQWMAKNMNIQPTINIRPGANFNVLLVKDLVLPAPYRF